MQTNHRKRPPVKGAGPRTKPSPGGKKMDVGTWSYIHRAGLCMTVIAFLVFAIAFVTLRITMTSFSMATVIELEFDPVAIEQMLEQLEEQQRRSADYSNVANRISNDGGEENTERRNRGGGAGGRHDAGGLNAALGDAEGTDAAELYEMAGKLGGQMGANRAAYEAGLQQVNSMSNQRDGGSDGSDEKNQTARIGGSVAVSYLFVDPVRNDDILIVPAYMCEGGGTVVVEAVLDRNGYVTSAVVDRSRSSSDECMRSTAVKAALGSRFNLDVSAPLKHKGTITYEFKPQ